MSKKTKGAPEERGGPAATSRSPEDKLRIVLSAATLKAEELGAFLRRESVHEAELEQWRAAMVAGLEGGTTKPVMRSTESKRIKELERELRRKDKALAEAAALLILQKKVREIWGDGDDDTDEGSGK